MRSDITVVMPTSFIPSHPSTAILEETVASVRYWLPDAEVVLTFDGLTADNASRFKDYEEYIRRALWIADRQWGAVCPLIMDRHRHQTGMMREAMKEIRTSQILYVEHDTPLVTDEPIDWSLITDYISAGHSSSVRLAHEAVVPEPHEYLMHGHDGHFLRTSQYSQRPHVATKAFFRRLLDLLPETDFIEEVAHGLVMQAHILDGMDGWNQWRLHIYDPGNGNMKRSYHLDGARS